jgi:hypothetical protein
MDLNNISEQKNRFGSVSADPALRSFKKIIIHENA